MIQTLLSLAGSSAGTFGIVFLAKDGIAPGQGFSYAEAPLFYLFGFLFSAIFCAVMAWRPSIRVKTSMALGLLTLGMAYAGMAVLHGYILVTFVPFFYGISIPLFYLPFNALIVKRTKPENRGMRMGVVFLVVTVTGVIAPTLAGQIIGAAGYATLFAFGFVCLLLDIILVLFFIDRNHEMVFRINYQSFGRRNVAAMFFEGCYEGLSIALIPLITLLFVKGEEQLGYIFSVFALAGGAMMLVLGFTSDRIRRRHLFMWAGAVMSSIFGLMVSLAPNLGSFVAGNSLLQLTGSVAPLFIFAMMADIGEDDPAGVSATREVLLNSGRAFSLSLYFVAAVAGVGIQTAFIAASMFLLLMLTGKGSGGADKPRT
jgi:MFS family permease